MGLQRYIQKRNFQRTPEPKGRPHRTKSKTLSFVTQKHDATRLHYDFRLEMEGVLKSWAVPKGIPTQKADKRLAMHVEDHPLEYGGFEGIIPEGNYGAGSVMLWDRGTYEVLGGDPLEALQKGKIHFRLNGKKLEGEWTLVRMRGREELGKEPWLLIKSGEDMEPISAKANDQSVRSGKTMAEIAHPRARVWHSNRSGTSQTKKPSRAGRSGERPTAKARAARPKVDSALLEAVEELPKQAPSYVDPMKALLVESPPRGKSWVYEIKWDGYRAVAVKRGDSVQLFSRRAREVTADFFQIAEAVRAIPVSNLVLDGEIVAVDARGHASFQLLQNYKQHRIGDGSTSLRYYVFDILNLENRDLKQLRLERRKQILEALLKDVADPIHFSASFQGNPDALLKEAEKNRIEGLIGKRADSVYEAGRRSGSWVKIKICLEQEFVIGGYTEPKWSRSHFGAILVGYYDSPRPSRRLIFASKVGTGFDENTLRDLYAKFQKTRSDTCPFANVPTSEGKSGHSLSRAEMRRCTWLQPKLVAQIRFTEWTDDGGLRHPVFLGLRDDKDASEVVREMPAKEAGDET